MLILNANLFDGTAFLSTHSLRIQEAVIEEIGEALTPEAGEAVFDARGGVISPGFVDIHIHGYGGWDAMQGREAIASMAKNLPRHGVTSFLPTTICAPIDQTHSALSDVARLMEEPPCGARVLGAHLEGPFLSAARKGAQPAEFIFPPSLSLYRAMVAGFEHAARLMTIAPDVEGALELIQALQGQIILSAGHSSATLEQVNASVEAGLSQVTHLFNAMNPLNHREPGVPGAALSNDRLSVQLIADLKHLDAAILKMAYRAKGCERCLLISDSMEAAGMPDGEYALGPNRVYVKDGEARLKEGNLAGSTLTLDRAVYNMVNSADVPLADALRMATRNPAESLGLKDIGILRPGARADLCLLNESLNVCQCWVDGLPQLNP